MWFDVSWHSLLPLITVTELEHKSRPQTPATQTFLTQSKLFIPNPDLPSCQEHSTPRTEGQIQAKHMTVWLHMGRKPENQKYSETNGCNYEPTNYKTSVRWVSHDTCVHKVKPTLQKEQLQTYFVDVWKILSILEDHIQFSTTLLNDQTSSHPQWQEIMPYEGRSSVSHQIPQRKNA